MSEHRAKVPVKAQIEAVVIRKDGTREDLGVISEWKEPWWRRLLRRLHVH